ncbi:hypothetical protein [Streptomyces sp. NPDC050988]|uniref:hypothetical protein n=1 Tax=Streptomyces sp. NPDC050988 TaxID=3365637 RepID=UPI0037AEBD2E
MADGTLAMARSDRVEAYGLTTGAPLWTWQPPDGEVLAHAPADAPDGVGVVLHHADGDGDRDGGAEHVSLTGLDPVDGRVVAERALPGHSYRARLAAAGDCLAVVCTAERPVHRLRVFRWK